jgi:WD40 repeat protein
VAQGLAMSNRKWLGSLLVCLLIGSSGYSIHAPVHAQNGSPVSALAWSPSGTHIVTGHDDGSVRLWDSSNGNLLQVFMGHTDKIFTLAWKPDETQIASGGFDTTVRIWDVETGETLAVLEDLSPTAAIGVTWTLDGTQIKTVGFDASEHFKTWNAETFELVSAGEGVGDAIRFIWSFDHTQLMIVNWACQLLIADPQTFEVETYLNEPSKKDMGGSCFPVTTGAWSPSGLLVAMGNNQGDVYIWDVSAQQPIFQLDATDLEQFERYASEVWSVAFDATQDRLFTVASDGTFRVWSVETGDMLFSSQLNHTRIHGDFSPDGKYFAYENDNGQIEILAVEDIINADSE